MTGSEGDGAITDGSTFLNLFFLERAMCGTVEDVLLVIEF